tara:strand:+ start:31705 stop:32505 length:801 start_codon:yes stop_codon:yes gene_type:complete
MDEVYLEAVGLSGPGLAGWEVSQPVLRGEQSWQDQVLPRYKPALLAANERRRATASVRMAFGACEDAVGDRLEEARELASVFVSSGGDYNTHDQICRGLLTEPVMLSPTQFHNSVHNAPAGYWSIATGSSAPSVSLSAFDYGISAGLMEALPLVALEQQSALLVFFDVAPCAPMNQVRAVTRSFATALWLTPARSANSLASLRLGLRGEAQYPETPASAASLETLRLANPAARILPLLERLALGQGATLVFATSAGQSLLLQLDCL